MKKFASFIILLALLLPAPLWGAGATNSGAVGTAYFFAARGSSDRNPCSRALPCTSLTKAASLIVGESGAILFRGGDSFTGCVTFSGAKIKSSSIYPATIGSYGTGNATLLANCPNTSPGMVQSYNAVLRIDGINGIIVKNLTISANGTATPFGILLVNSTATKTGFVTIENNNISGFYATGGTGFGLSAEVGVLGFLSTCAGMHDVSILNNTLHGVSGVSSPDIAGVSGFACGTNISNYTVQGNLVYNLGGEGGGATNNWSQGVIENGANGGLMQFNLVHDLAWNVLTGGGPVAQWTSNVTGVIIQFGESYNVQSSGTSGATDFNGYDFDIATANSVGQYLYSHGNAGYGYTFYASGEWNDNTFRYSISENDGFRYNQPGAGIVEFSGYNGTGAAYVYNMTVWNSPRGTSGFAMAGRSPSGGLFANNIIVSQNDRDGVSRFIACNTVTPSSSFLFAHNDYYSPGGGAPSFYQCPGTYSTLAAWQAVAPGGDVGSTQVNPGLVSGGTGVTCAWTPSTILSWPPSTCPSGSALASGAAAKSAGIDLGASPFSQTVGTRDYYGNSIPGTGPCYNVGAYSVCP